MLKVLSFCDRKEGLTSFNINNRVNFSGEQKQNETLSFFVVVFCFLVFF